MDALLNEANESVAVLTAALSIVVDPAELGTIAKIPTKVLCYREALLWRTEELSRSACRHYESEDLASAITLTRAAIEGIAATWYLKSSVEKVVKNKSVGSFDDKIMRLLQGSRDELSEYDAYNVLDFIDSIDKRIPNFRNVYESLCEYAHPNWSGVSGLFSRVDHEKVLTEFGRNLRNTERQASLGLHALIGSLAMYQLAYEGIDILIPELIVICESDLEA